MANVISYKGKKYVRVDASENQKATSLLLASENIKNRAKRLQDFIKSAANKGFENCEKEFKDIGYYIDSIVKNAESLKKNRF